MKNSLVITIAAVALIGGYLAWPKTEIPSDGKVAAIQMILHKSPTCGCCEIYGAYMRKRGYEVDENNMSDASLSVLKRDSGIPREVWSCHTSEIGGYIVEGHIPNEAVEKLLAEKPDIKGIGMAGMPSGSPGMPGPKTDFMIYEINKDGTLGDLFMQM